MEMYIKRCVYLFLLLACISCDNKETSDHSKLIVIDPTPYEYLNVDSLEIAIDAYFEGQRRANLFLGSAISIVQHDSTLIEKGYGISNIATSERVDQNSVFRLGSISKSFQATLAGILVQEDLLSWDERLISCYEDFRLQNDTFAETITLEHILSHSAGFPYHSYTNLVEAGASLKNIAAEFVQIKNLKKPGSLYSYQNAAFSFSSLILERELQESTAALFQKYMFDPLEMDNASCTRKDILQADKIAFPHHKNKKGKWSKRPINNKYYNTIAAGGVNASASDMSKFMHLVIGNHPDILGAGQIGKITSPQIETKVGRRYYRRWPGFQDTYYGLGWRVHTISDNDMKTDTIIHHGGQVSGYRNEIAIVTDEGLGISVLFNSYSPTAKTIIPEVIGICKKLAQSARIPKEAILIEGK